MAAFTATVAANSVPAQARDGVHLSGTLTATESERTEQIATFGQAVALIVKDKALWAQVEPMLDREVQFSLFTI